MGRKTKLGIALHCNDMEMTEIVRKDVMNYPKDDTIKVAYAPSEAQYYLLIKCDGFWKPLYADTLSGIMESLQPDGPAPRQRWMLELRALVELAIAKESRLSRKNP